MRFYGKKREGEGKEKMKNENSTPLPFLFSRHAFAHCSSHKDRACLIDDQEGRNILNSNSHHCMDDIVGLQKSYHKKFSKIVNYMCEFKGVLWGVGCGRVSEVYTGV